ncbi:hypothetical protein HK405_015977, partial [Cladochytrium tenue]
MADDQPAAGGVPPQPPTPAAVATFIMAFPVVAFGRAPAAASTSTTLSAANATAATTTTDWFYRNPFWARVVEEKTKEDTLAEGLGGSVSYYFQLTTDPTDLPPEPHVIREALTVEHGQADGAAAQERLSVTIYSVPRRGVEDNVLTGAWMVGFRRKYFGYLVCADVCDKEALAEFEDVYKNKWAPVMLDQKHWVFRLFERRQENALDRLPGSTLAVFGTEKELAEHAGALEDAKALAERLGFVFTKVVKDDPDSFADAIRLTARHVYSV